MDDPRKMDGEFNELFETMRKCKFNKTCRQLKVRGYYYEPNAYTIIEWKKDNMFVDKIDRRVMFICESPGPKSNKSETIDRGWSISSKDRRFHEIKKIYGFKNGYITDVVKCGIRAGTKHKENEINNCVGYVIKEINLIKPMVAVCVGNNAYKLVRERILCKSIYKPVLFRITHYSARKNINETWSQEFKELKRLVDRLKPQEHWSPV